MSKNKRKFSFVKTPYRISLGGGGTDLPFYSSKKSGFLLTAAIDQYMTVLVAPRQLDNKILLQYSKTEWASNVDQVKHDILRETMKYFKIQNSFQIATFSTLPTQTGLGSSSALIVGLITAIRNLIRQPKSQIKVAREAFHIEREIMGLSGGVQDQYISALGGILEIQISKSGLVRTNPLRLTKERLSKLEDSIVLVSSGVQRKSEQIIDDQKTANKIDEKNIIECYNKIKKIGYQSKEFIVNGDIYSLGHAMDEHWRVKKSMTRSMTTSSIDRMYTQLKSLGALGGKIIGAGGGGFFLMIVDKDKEKYQKKLQARGFTILECKFEFNGCHLIG